ncbi:nickel ABC transporter permease subunit NikB [Helicobacter didelphidarum]|uniref:Nickel ABC transporter permease subunit NikB n=1 Tax=Helicobacter didelphidarum TaxID=2040648 RepID=A0A3D8IMC8_9HELI|nr:ABC transporter permease subunit [Helicobacter didelphidarum]RDU66388.1 nickel ABC transporter permease subunit NikB [Helicobacter didelphidarum]
MLSYIFQRILYMIPILFLSSLVIFIALRVSNIDPVTQYIIHSNLPPTPEVIQAIQHDFGLDKPIMEQYWLWLKKAVMLDFGNSYITGRSVSQDFLYFLPQTLLLGGCAFVILLFFSIPLGILSAMYRDKIPDFIIRFICFLGVSTPSFWLAFLLIFVFSIKLEWLPPLGLESAKSLIMPALSIAFMSMCVNTRLIRSNMLEVKKERHLLYAKLRGLNKTTINLKHTFYNALLPIVTSFGMHLGEIIGWALVVENVFAISGVGLYSVQGFANHDYPIIQCFVIVMCFIFTLCNLIIDILYAFLDPRIRRNIEES